MSNIQAAVGVAQLEKIEEHLALKRELGASYQAKLKGIQGLQLPVEKTEYAQNLYWVFGMVLEEDVPIDASGIMKKLAEQKTVAAHFFIQCICNQYLKRWDYLSMYLILLRKIGREDSMYLVD